MDLNIRYKPVSEMKDFTNVYIGIEQCGSDTVTIFACIEGSKQFPLLRISDGKIILKPIDPAYENCFELDDNSYMEVTK